MKSARNSEHLVEQLSRQPGIFLPDPKEPNFFSNDEQYARGIDWYTGLFDQAAPFLFSGEASTHLHEIANVPETVQRMRSYFNRSWSDLRHARPGAATSFAIQFHQWTEGEIVVGWIVPLIVTGTHRLQQLRATADTVHRSVR